MSVTLAYMQARFKGLDLTDTTFVANMIAWAESEVSSTSDLWGDRRDQAVANLAAHFIAQNSSTSGPASGPVTSEKVGDQSVTFKAPDVTGSSLMATPYGQEYKRLIGTVATSPVVV